KNGKTVTRALNKDRTHKNLIGGVTSIHGRSLMLLRNVGHLMTNPAILVDGAEIYEGIMDALVTPLLSFADIRVKTKSRTRVKVLCISLNQKCMVLKKLLLQLNCLSVLNRH